MRNIKNYHTKILLYVDTNKVKKKVFYDVNGEKLQVYINNHNELYYINPKDGKNYSINNDGNFYYYDFKTNYNSCDLNHDKFYKFYGSNKEIKQYEKIEKFMPKNGKTTVSISKDKNKQVEITFDFIKKMKNEVEKIKKQYEKLSINIKENEYLKALKVIYKKSCNKYSNSTPLVNYISKKDNSKNDILVITPIDQDESGVDYYLKDNTYAEKIKRDLQNIMKAIKGLNNDIKKTYGFIFN